MRKSVYRCIYLWFFLTNIFFKILSCNTMQVWNMIKINVLSYHWWLMKFPFFCCRNITIHCWLLTWLCSPTVQGMILTFLSLSASDERVKLLMSIISVVQMKKIIGSWEGWIGHVTLLNVVGYLIDLCFVVEWNLPSLFIPKYFRRLSEHWSWYVCSFIYVWNGWTYWSLLVMVFWQTFISSVSML